jgi:ATP-dependent Clp protease adaptor protein ClpS
MSHNKENDVVFDGGLQLEEEHKLDEPKMFRVILHNDNYSTMEFVIEVLMKVFHMTSEPAAKIMLDVHKKGKGICGIYTRDIAATKVNQVHNMAKEQNYPLKCSYEEA